MNELYSQVYENTQSCDLFSKAYDNLCSRSYSDAIELINGRDLSEIRAKCGSTLLLAMAHKGMTEQFVFLLENGANIEDVDNSGSTALMKAAFYGNNEIVDILIERGCKLNVRNNKGVTSLMLACNQGHISIIKRLLIAGADKSIRDNEGRNAEILAVLNDQHEAAWLLFQTIFNINNNYYFSGVNKKEENEYDYKRLLSFRLNLPNMPIVELSNVERFEIALKEKYTSKKTSQVKKYQISRINRIFDEQDLSDFYLIIYKVIDAVGDFNMTYRYDIHIYYNCELVNIIKNTTGFTQPRNNFDVDNLFFDRAKKDERVGRIKWKCCNGEEIFIDASEDISFYDWCIKYDRKDLIDEYLEKNETKVTDKNLLWDDDINIWWRCSKCGREWGKIYMLVLR